MLGLGIGIGKNKSNTSSYSPEALAFFNALPTQPDDRVKAAYNNLWVNYPALMALHDILYQNAAQYEDNKRTNLITPTSFYQSKISTPTFKPMQGVSGGVGKAYDTGWIPSSDGVNYTLSNGCIWWYGWGRASTYSNKNILGCNIVGEAGTIGAFFDVNPNLYAAVNCYFSINASPIPVSNYYGLWSITRVGSAIKVYHNATLIYSKNDAAIALPTFSLYELAKNSAGTTSGGQLATIIAMGVGSASIDQTELYNMMRGYLGDIPTWKFYGDSIFDGYGLASPQTESIPYLLSIGKGQYQFNHSISSTTVKNFVDSNETIEKTNLSTGCIFFDWYINDAVEALGTVTFKANYRTVIDMAIAAGCPVSRIFIINKWYQTGIPLGVVDPYSVAAAEVAAEYGIVSFDLSGLAYALQGDNIHPSAAGCVTAANYLIANT